MAGLALTQQVLDTPTLGVLAVDAGIGHPWRYLVDGAGDDQWVFSRR